MLWDRTGGSQFSPADRTDLYVRRKSRIHHSHVYPHRAGHGDFHREKGGDEDLDRCGACGCRNVFPLHYRRISYGPGGFPCISLCGYIFRSYTADRLFFAQNRRRGALMYPVLRVRHLVCSTYAHIRETEDCRDRGGVDASGLCGSAVMRCWIYASDRGAKKYRSYCGVSDPQSGICIFSSDRLGHTGRKTLRPGTFWLCTCIYRCDTCPASEKEAAGRRYFIILPVYFSFVSRSTISGNSIPWDAFTRIVSLSLSMSSICSKNSALL